MADKMADKIAQRIDVLPPLRHVIRTHGLDAKKSLGQNFLLDLNLTGRIARTACPLKGTVIEIGAGPGGLTRALLLAGAEKVIAVEKDQRAIAALQPLSIAAQGRLEIIQADALNIDISMLGAPSKPRQIVANLPYNIATKLLLNWLDRLSQIDAMTLMFQREVGHRITAESGTPAYGRLSVIVQWLCEARMLFEVPPQAFIPPPKVVSCVLGLKPRTAPLAPADKASLEQVTRALFGQRRKMLRASIKGLKCDGLLDSLIQNTHLKGDERPQDLTIADFCMIANALDKKRQNKSNT